MIRGARATALVVAAVGLAWAHLAFTREYGPASFAKLLALQAPLPFGHRVLIPWLARPLVDAGVAVRHVFAVVDAVSIAAVLWSVPAALRTWLGARRADVLAVLLVLFFALVYVVPRRWPLFYPWDMPALAVVSLGLLAVLRRRFGLATLLTFVGALNRETAILVPACALAVHVDTQGPARRELWAWLRAMVGLYLVARLGVALALPDNPGPPLHFTIGKGGYRVESNLAWFRQARHLAWLPVYLGGLPLLWPAVARRVPRALHRVGLVGLAWFLASMIVANVYEPRAYGESLLLMAAAAACGLLRPRQDPDPAATRPGDSTSDPRLARLDRYAAPLLFIAFGVFVWALRQWRFLPVAQWPMPPG